MDECVLGTTKIAPGPPGGVGESILPNQLISSWNDRIWFFEFNSVILQKKLKPKKGSSFVQGHPFVSVNQEVTLRSTLVWWEPLPGAQAWVGCELYISRTGASTMKTGLSSSLFQPQICSERCSSLPFFCRKGSQEDHESEISSLSSRSRSNEGQEEEPWAPSPSIPLVNIYSFPFSGWKSRGSQGAACETRSQGFREACSCERWLSTGLGTTGCVRQPGFCIGPCYYVGHCGCNCSSAQGRFCLLGA